MERVLVVGATGTLGGMVARGLLERGERVRAFVRKGSDLAALAEAGAELAFGDLKEPETLPPALEGVERIVSTATASSRGGDDTIETVDREGTGALIDAVGEASVEQFLYVSAYGFEKDSPVAIARAKAESEERLRASGIPFTILRPGMFMEIWIGHVVGAQLRADSSVTVVGDPDRPFGFTAVENVADLALATLRDPKAENRTITLCTDVASYREIVEEIGRVTGRRIDIRSVPPRERVQGLPPIVAEIWATIGEVGAPPVTDDVHRTYGIRPMTVEAFVQRTFGPEQR